MKINKIYQKLIQTPLGVMISYATDQGICLLDFYDKENLHQSLNSIQKSLHSELLSESHFYLELLENELQLYFQKKITYFSVPIHFIGTEFQKSVWRVLMQIPYGKTISYQQQAKILGNPKAVRAVANANSKNNISILIPCHRVIGSDGTLTGYAGGLWRKEKLLDLENMPK